MNSLQTKRTLEDLRKKMANASTKSMKPRTFSRPRVGSRGASGPRGLWIREGMVAQVNKIASDPRKPYYNLANQVSTILYRARRGELLVENFPERMETMNRILNKLLLWDNASRKPNASPKPIKLTPMEERVLEEFSRT